MSCLPQIKVTGFSEQDQENLYNATQDGKSSGKKGLGKSSQPKDIGGVKWVGKKTVLDEADLQDDDVAAVAQPAQPVHTQAADTRQTAASAAQVEVVRASAENVKWKKKARQLLSAAPEGQMKLKKLQKRLLQQSKCPEAAWEQHRTDMLTQLSSSKQFKLADTNIFLL